MGSAVVVLIFFLVQPPTFCHSHGQSHDQDITLAQTRLLQSEVERLKAILVLEQVEKDGLVNEIRQLRKESSVCRSQTDELVHTVKMIKGGLAAEKIRLRQVEDDIIECKYRRYDQNPLPGHSQSVNQSTVSQACTKHAVPNHSFEEDSAWVAYGTSGFSYSNAEAYDGQRSARVTNGGCNQKFVITNSVRKLIISGYSKQTGVTGIDDPDYSLYCDIKHTDNTWTYGESSHFKTGNAGHSWHRAVLNINSQKDIGEAWCYALLRGHHQGVAYFDKIEMWILNKGADFPTCQI